MNLRQIRDMQIEMDQTIRRVANSIDPKLLGYLNFQDIFDDKYMNNDLHLQYNEKLAELIRQSEIQVQIKCEQYIVDFINDMSTVLDITGYLTSTGEETRSFDDYNSIPSNYIPCIEIEPIWNVVHELRNEYRYSPFWKKSGYTLYGNGETVYVTSHDYPSTFIMNNRSYFNRSYGDTSLGKFERAARFKDTKFDYPIYVPALSQYESRSLPNSYEESIRRHLILKEAIESNITENSIEFKSEIDSDGNVKLQSI